MTTGTIERSLDCPIGILGTPRDCGTLASYERELADHRLVEASLKIVLANRETAILEKDALIERKALSSRESDHRFLNDLQMIVSLLLLQSRASANPDTVEQLAIAANRVGMIARIHRRLHSFDGAQVMRFKPYLEDLCEDFSAMLSSDDRTLEVTIAEGSDFELPAATGTALGFIVSELLANAAKHGTGKIAVTLMPGTEKGHVLSVSNQDPALPEGFDPAACKGLGMKIVGSFVQRIKGELRFGRGVENQGACFSVSFS